MIAERGIDDLGQRAGPRHAHEWASRDQVGEVESGNTERLGLLHHGRGSDGEVRPDIHQSREVVLEGRPVAHRDAPGLEPVPVGLGMRRAGAGGAHVGEFAPLSTRRRPTSQLGALVARQGDPAPDRMAPSAPLIMGRTRFFARLDRGARHGAGFTDAVEPIGGAVVPHRRRADDRSPGGYEFAEDAV